MGAADDANENRKVVFKLIVDISKRLMKWMFGHVHSKATCSRLLLQMATCEWAELAQQEPSDLHSGLL